MNNFYKDNEALKKQLQHPLMERIAEMCEKGYTNEDGSEYAPKDYNDLQDSYDKTLEILGEISAEVIAANAAGVDLEGPHCADGRVTYASGTQQNHETLIEAGLYGMTMPRRYGGLNFPTTLFVMASEIVARADAGFCNIWSLQSCADTINEFAEDELKEEFLPLIAEGATCSMDLTEPDSGSDLQSATLRATWNEELGEWRLNGVKRFITNGDADVKLILARSEEGTSDGRGLSYFVYNKKWGGITVRRIEHKMGIKGSPTCELVFKDAPAKLIGRRRMGLIKYVMALMNSARLGIGAQSVGISEAAYREAKRYAAERKQFGQTIDNFAAVQEMLQSMKARLDASRALLYETSRNVDMYKLMQTKAQLTNEEKAEMKQYQQDADMLTPLLKLTSSEYCNRNTYDAVQVYGGSGYMRDFTVERLYRDARVTSIYEGTSQLQVVAAIRYVTNGALLNKIEKYLEQLPASEQKSRLTVMTEQFASACTMAAEQGAAFTDRHARRLVEMGAGIVMGALLLLDKADEQSANLYIRMAQAENAAAITFMTA
ncbi:MAG: acyl-CoA dehydrogenase family protein [Tidjanibacter sp.]|nr:acyl-CoA dehydrogenase family protein [Tidjanibacter sp.]